MDSEFKEALDKFLNETVAEFHEKVATLSKEQFKEALRQALESGDFIRCVTAGHMDHAQAIVYQPYRDHMMLNQRINKLTYLLDGLYKEAETAGLHTPYVFETEEYMRTGE